jgi:hypothetical protein
MNEGEAAFVVAYEERAGAECLRRFLGQAYLVGNVTLQGWDNCLGSLIPSPAACFRSSSPAADGPPKTNSAVVPGAAGTVLREDLRRKGVEHRGLGPPGSGAHRTLENKSAFASGHAQIRRAAVRGTDFLDLRLCILEPAALGDAREEIVHTLVVDDFLAFFKLGARLGAACPFFGFRLGRGEAGDVAPAVRFF